MSEWRNRELPKGMCPPEAPEIKQPVPLHLGRGNYVAAIYQALGILPIEIRVNECIVTERHGQEAEVKLTLHILGEREAHDGNYD